MKHLTKCPKKLAQKIGSIYGASVIVDDFPVGGRKWKRRRNGDEDSKPAKHFGRRVELFLGAAPQNDRLTGAEGLAPHSTTLGERLTLFNSLWKASTREPWGITIRIASTLLLYSRADRALRDDIFVRKIRHSRLLLNKVFSKVVLTAIILSLGTFFFIFHFFPRCFNHFCVFR